MPRRLTVAGVRACCLAQASASQRGSGEVLARVWRRRDEAARAPSGAITNSSRSSGSRLAGDDGCEAQSDRLRAATGTVALLPGGRELSLSLRLSISRK